MPFHQSLIKLEGEFPSGRLTCCGSCGAPVYRWPMAWSIEEFGEVSSLSRAYLYQRISLKELEIRKGGSRSVILFEEGWRFLNALPVFEPKARARKEGGK